MNLITDYWEPLVTFVLLVTILTRMRVDIDVLKDKVKTLFDLFNKKEKYGEYYARKSMFETQRKS